MSINQTSQTRVAAGRAALLACLALVALLALLGSAALARETRQLLTDLMQLVLCLAAAAGTLRAARRAESEARWFWSLVAAFVGIWGVAQLLWTLDAQGLAPAGAIAPSDFLFLAASAPLVLAFVLRPDREREGRLAFAFDAALVIVFALHAYVYFTFAYLAEGANERYHEWINALGNLDSVVVVLVACWAYRSSVGPWKLIYGELALVLLLLHGGSAISSHALLKGEYTPGLLDLPWSLPFLLLAFVAFGWRPVPDAQPRPAVSDFVDTRRGLVLAILVIVGVPSLHLVAELTGSLDPKSAPLRGLLTLISTGFLGTLFLARQLALLRRTERLHLDREEDLERLFNSNPLPLFLCAKTGLHVLDVNRAAESLYGLDREMFLAMSLAELHVDEEADALESLIGESDGHLPGDFHHRTAKGSTLTVELTARALTLGGREAYLVVVADVTEHRDLEDRLRHSQKMEALGRLAGGVAHDFNNMLTAILGYSSLLGLALKAGRSRSFAHEIQRSGERAAALTKQLLAFSRKQVLVPEVLRLDEVARDVGTLLRPSIGEDVQLSITAGDDLGRIRADRGQIEQVIMNLAVNAKDAMPEGGKLVIRADNDIDGRMVVLTVEDTGAGMSDETLSRMFEPFFTTKPRGKGTGLGLATVYGIVAQSGGTVDVKSQLGIGTHFTVALPRCGDYPEAGTSPEESRVPARAATILLVEDEEVVRRLTRLLLEEQGYEVLTAGGGGEAISLATARTEDVDLLVTDVVMPGMKGPELVSKLREKQPDLKVLYVSGYAADGLGLGLGLGLDLEPEPDDQALRNFAFLQKPFTASALARHVQIVLDSNPGSGSRSLQ